MKSFIKRLIDHSASVSRGVRMELFLGGVLIFLLCLWPADSRTGTGQPETIDVEDIKPGMKGYGLSVFKGTEPERFDVEVIAVLRQFRLRQDIVLIRCSHPVIEKAGVIAGMSGSPIYLDGKLAGALAYGWSFSTEPIAGVTPIKNMLKTLDIARKAVAGGKKRLRNALNIMPQAKSTKLAAAQEPQTVIEHGSVLNMPEPVYVETPLVVGGFSPEALKELEDSLREYALTPLRGGGGRATAGGDAGRGILVAGSAMGVELARGDLSAVGVGTVTAVIGRRALAFGHPMMNIGRSSLGVTTAKVHHVVKSLYRSFKLADPVADAGRLVEDRQAAVVADTGLKADMIPLNIRVNSRISSFRDSYRVDVARHRYLTPLISYLAVRSIVDEGASDLDGATIRIRGEMKLDGGRKVETEQTVFSTLGARSVILRLKPVSAIPRILHNSFEETGIKEVNMDLDISYRRDVMTIRGAYLTTDTPEPGQLLNLHVRVQPFGHSERVLTIPVKIPHSTAGQSITIDVEGGGSVQPDLPPPRGLDDYIANLEKAYPERSIVVTIWLKSAGVLVQGKAVNRLPASALDSLRPLAADAQEVPQRAVERTVTETDSLVSGRAWVKVKVRKEKKLN